MSGFEAPIQPTAPDLGGLHLNDYILTALNKSAVDPLNASRLIAGASNYLSGEVHDGLQGVFWDHDGEEVADRIVAPVLRTIDDFKDEPRVMVQGNTPQSRWEFQDVFGPDEKDQTLVLETKVRTIVAVQPQLPSLFTERDHNILKKPNFGSRPIGLALAARFAIGLSFFDVEAANADFVERIRAVHRHYTLGFSPSTFNPEADERHLRSVPPVGQLPFPRSERS